MTSRPNQSKEPAPPLAQLSIVAPHGPAMTKPLSPGVDFIYLVDLAATLTTIKTARKADNTPQFAKRTNGGRGAE